MSLENLRSVFLTDFSSERSIENFKEIYQSNKPEDKFNTKFNYNETPLINQTYAFGVSINSPILDSVLRGRVYTQQQFSQNFTNDNLFVKPETGEVQEQLFRTQTFDPRATTPKEGTLYFNTNKTMGTLQYGEGGFQQNTTFNSKITDFSTAVGNNDSPYTPLSQLGINFYNGENDDKNLSWESLYNANHTPKDIPRWEAGGLSAVNYGPNVNRDKLNIRDSDMNGNIFSWPRSFFGIEAEPYMVSPIGSVIQNAGSREVPIIRGLVDGLRLGKFIASPAGLQFIARQNLLGLISKSEYPLTDKKGNNFAIQASPQRHAPFYNPLSTIGAAAARLTGPQPNIYIRKDIFFPNIFGPSLEGLPSLESAYPDNLGKLPKVNLSFLNQDESIIGFGTNFPIAGGGKFRSGAVKSGDKMTLGPMIKGSSLIPGGSVTVLDTTKEFGYGAGEEGLPATEPLGLDAESIEHGMPFYFKDLRDDTYIFFRAYIEGLTENISPSYASTNYIGRSEPVYIYERAEREISMTLKLIAQTPDELISIYKKMDRLTSMCYPQYVDGGEDGYGNRMKPPLAKLRYGEMFGNTNKELMGYIKSISYTVDNSSTYETEQNKRVPKHVIATLGYQVIHDKTPGLGRTTFYGINQNG